MICTVRGSTKSYPVKWEQQRPLAAKSRSHISNIVPACFAERVWCMHSIPFLTRKPFTSVLVGSNPRSRLIHFCCGPDTCSYCTKVWNRTYPISYASLRDRRGAASLRHKNRAATTFLRGCLHEKTQTAVINISNLRILISCRFVCYATYIFKSGIKTVTILWKLYMKYK